MVGLALTKSQSNLGSSKNLVLVFLSGQSPSLCHKLWMKELKELFCKSVMIDNTIILENLHVPMAVGYGYSIRPIILKKS